MGDILVYSNTKNNHIKHVKMMLNALKYKNLKIKTEKCRFHVQKITSLNYIIISKTIQIKTNKINNIQIWPGPKNIKKLQKSLKFKGFYQNIIPKYAKWTSTITDLLTKNNFFEWGLNQAIKLMQFKKYFVRNRQLAMYDPENYIKLLTETSNELIKLIMFQKKPIKLLLITKINHNRNKLYHG